MQEERQIKISKSKNKVRTDPKKRKTDPPKKRVCSYVKRVCVAAIKKNLAAVKWNPDTIATGAISRRYNRNVICSLRLRNPNKRNRARLTKWFVQSMCTCDTRYNHRYNYYRIRYLNIAFIIMFRLTIFIFLKKLKIVNCLKVTLN